MQGFETSYNASTKPTTHVATTTVHDVHQLAVANVQAGADGGLPPAAGGLGA